MAKKVPEINASSQADIAFLLLVFFLITTTMNTDSGMYRRLPAFQDNQQAMVIAQRNIMQILVNRENMVLLEGEIVDIGMIKDKAVEFILNPNNSPNLPDKQVKEIELLGNVEVSKGIISLRNDVGTSYKTYIAVQDQLAIAYKEARDIRAMGRFGRKYDSLSREEQEAIRDWVPMVISEAEPKVTRR